MRIGRLVHEAYDKPSLGNNNIKLWVINWHVTWNIVFLYPYSVTSTFLRPFCYNSWQYLRNQIWLYCVTFYIDCLCMFSSPMGWFLHIKHNYRYRLNETNQWNKHSWTKIWHSTFLTKCHIPILPSKVQLPSSSNQGKVTKDRKKKLCEWHPYFLTVLCGSSSSGSK